MGKSHTAKTQEERWAYTEEVKSADAVLPTASQETSPAEPTEGLPGGTAAPCEVPPGERNPITPPSHNHETGPLAFWAKAVLPWFGVALALLSLAYWLGGVSKTVTTNEQAVSIQRQGHSELGKQIALIEGRLHDLSGTEQTRISTELEHLKQQSKQASANRAEILRKVLLLERQLTSVRNSQERR